MSALDLTAAVEAASVSIWATTDEGAWMEQPEGVRAEMRDAVEFYATHLAPLIEAAAREQIVADLKAAHAQSLAAGGALEHTFEDGLADAARIVLGGAR